MSMYQATISAQGAQRAQTSTGKRHKTPMGRKGKVDDSQGVKYSRSDAKLNTILKKEQSRKFGEYEGSEFDSANTKTGIWGNNPCK